jgi:hypothetical protein
MVSTVFSIFLSPLLALLLLLVYNSGLAFYGVLGGVGTGFLVYGVIFLGLAIFSFIFLHQWPMVGAVYLGMSLVLCILPGSWLVHLMRKRTR